MSDEKKTAALSGEELENVTGGRVNIVPREKKYCPSCKKTTMHKYWMSQDCWICEVCDKVNPKA